MGIGERILLGLSRPAESGDYSTSGEWTEGNALDLLHEEFPGFERMVAGKRVADFGCGEGYQCIALVKRFGCFAVGIDSNPKAVRRGRELGKAFGIGAERLAFYEETMEDMVDSFDIVISQNSFEHFGNPKAILKEMGRLLKTSGKVLITFGPPWLSPYGSHMHFFCKIPWINVLFSEKTVMKVRSLYRSDGAAQYGQVESGLNRMTLAKFEHMIESQRMKIAFRKYRCVKGMNFLASLPLIREFFVNRVSVVLSKQMWRVE